MYSAFSTRHLSMGLALAEDAVHPDTGHNIVGATIPHWDQIVTEVKLAAKAFAGIRTQSWDIALSDPAPTFLEMNFGGDFNLHQFAHGAGVLDESIVHISGAVVTAENSEPRQTDASVCRWLLQSAAYERAKRECERCRWRRAGRKGRCCAAAASGGALAPRRLRDLRVGRGRIRNA